MKRDTVRMTLCALIFFAAFAHVAAAAPVAPSLLAPADGAGVQVPFTISWSSVSDPSGIAAYNWQVSATSSFSSIVLQNSTNGATQDTVSGLPDGTYFWRVQAVDGTFTQGAWSSARSFTVTGTGPDSPGTPALAPTQAYSTFHPMETMTFNWNAVPGATSYVLQAATDPSFPIITRLQFDNISGTTYTFAVSDGNQGHYWARVYAVNANGIAGVPSNVITFSVFFSNPIGPAPVLSSPASGTTLTLPVSVSWQNVPNPQPSGYELQVSSDSKFSAIEYDDPQLTDPTQQLLSLTSGTKFWRVRSEQGDSSPFTAAMTAWSSTGTFTIPAGPPAPVSVTLTRNSLVAGQTTIIQLQLSSAVGSSGAAISLASSNSSALPVPASVTMPANTAWMQFDLSQFGLRAGSVTQATSGTITATINGGSASAPFTIMPPSLASASISPSTIGGGAQANGTVTLNAAAPSGGALVALASDSAAMSPPSTVTIAPGLQSASFAINTISVSANTAATLTASWNGSSVLAHATITPPAAAPAPALTTLALNPANLAGGNSATATVTLTAAAPAGGASVSLSSSSAAAAVPASVTIAAGATSATFAVTTAAVSASTAATITASYGGATRSSTLTVNPPAPPPPATAALTVTAAGRSGERITSSPAGISVAVGTTGSASFNAGAAVTLTVSNGRDAIWSGACSSNGAKAKSCTLTLNAASGVTANVQ